MNVASTCFFAEDWPVFYEDNHLLALYKPSGLLVQADQTGDVSLLELAKIWLKKRYQKPGRVFLGIVHRLDRPVAGVILFARTSKAAARLSEQFRTGRVEKQYMAVVEGIVKEPSAQLVHQLERIPGQSSRIVEKPTKNSRQVRLSYRIIDTHRSKSLVKIDLETGRHHQIRAQMAYLGHPVVGDLRYGAPAPLPEKQIALCATRLAVWHPTRKDRLAFQSPCPRGWPWPGLDADALAPPWNWSALYPEVDGLVQNEIRE